MLPTKKFACKAVDSIATHYSQPIHIFSRSDATESYDKNNHNKNENDSCGNDDDGGNQSVVRQDQVYFDPLLGYPVETPPIIQHWITRAHIQYTSTSSEKLSNGYDGGGFFIPKDIVMAVSIVCTYSSHIRNKCFLYRRRMGGIHIQQQTESAYMILIHYEIFLSKLLSIDSPEKDSTENAKDSNALNIDTLQKEEEKHSSMIETLKELQTAIHTMIHDIFQITNYARDLQDKLEKQQSDEQSKTDDKNSKKDMEDIEYNLDKTRNAILPILLQILVHSIHLLNTLILLLRKSTIGGHLVELQQKDDWLCIKDIMCHVTMVAFMFYTPSEKDDKEIYSSNDANCTNNRQPQSPTKRNFNANQGQLDIDTVLLPQIWKELNLTHSIETCAYPPCIVTEEEKSSKREQYSGTACRENTVDISNNKQIDDTKDLKSIFQMILSSVNPDPADGEEHDEALNNLSFLTDSILIGRSKDTILDMPWMDHIRGTSSRIAQNLIHKIACLSTSHGDGNESSSNTKISTPSHVSVLERIMDQIGLEVMLPLFRANFFGRMTFPEIDLESEDDEINHSSTELVKRDGKEYNGYKVSKRKERVDDIEQIQVMKMVQQESRAKHSKRVVRKGFEKMSFVEDEAYIKSPARIPPVLRLLKSIKHPRVTPTVLDDALPMLYALIDSNVSVHQSLGGAVLLYLLREYYILIISDEQGEKVNKDGIRILETAYQVVTIVCRSCRNPTAITILSKVRCFLFEIFGSLSSSSLLLLQGEKPGVLQRESLNDFLTLVKKSSHNNESENLSVLTGVLIGGIHPLLVQLAKLPNANAMESGRLGLSTLLPLIRWDSVTLEGRRIQMSAISCLISLMMGAYPIMDKHGGKIMSELIGCIGRAQRDLMIQNKSRRNRQSYIAESDREYNATKLLLAFTIHAASVTLALCGERADAILTKVEKGDYIPQLVTCCLEVRRRGAMMLTQENQKK